MSIAVEQGTIHKASVDKHRFIFGLVRRAWRHHRVVGGGGHDARSPHGPRAHRWHMSVGKLRGKRRRNRLRRDLLRRGLQRCDILRRDLLRRDLFGRNNGRLGLPRCKPRAHRRFEDEVIALLGRLLGRRLKRLVSRLPHQRRANRWLAMEPSGFLLVRGDEPRADRGCLLKVQLRGAFRRHRGIDQSLRSLEALVHTWLRTLGPLGGRELGVDRTEVNRGHGS
mmetsp:Transcript_73168/g.202947  ORF Transcript_73168/g.202947 Transcript_73168/m.202947 type:complete len:224 (-) Transcript_73168:128-799(-)